MQKMVFFRIVIEAIMLNQIPAVSPARRIQGIVHLHGRKTGQTHQIAEQACVVGTHAHPPAEQYHPVGSGGFCAAEIVVKDDGFADMLTAIIQDGRQSGFRRIGRVILCRRQVLVQKKFKIRLRHTKLSFSFQRQLARLVSLSVQKKMTGDIRQVQTILPRKHIDKNTCLTGPGFPGFGYRSCKYSGAGFERCDGTVFGDCCVLRVAAGIGNRKIRIIGERFPYMRPANMDEVDIGRLINLRIRKRRRFFRPGCCRDEDEQNQKQTQKTI